MLIHNTLNLRQHVLAWLALVVAFCVLVGCDLVQKRKRRFGSTCGVASECESGVCYKGICTTSCVTGGECESGICQENVCQAPDGDYDGDGLRNKRESLFGLAADKADSDGDGLGDAEEFGDDLNKPKDSNGNGKPDALESNIVDSDGDCMLDAFDTVPGGPDPLPAASALCANGVCAANLAQVQVLCSPGSGDGVVLGCKGCICQATGVTGWQASEQACDGLDNDCDGGTDEQLLFGDAPLGAACVGIDGPCKGKPGVVECGKDKKATCSSQGNGSAAKGVPETCNLADDDCDGTIDDGFTYAQTPVGGSCASCGFQAALCPDGQPANPPVVTCSADGKSAICGAIPFAPGFAELTSGAPQPQAHWSATFAPAWQRLLLYGGRVPAANGPAERDDVWSLDLSGYGAGQSAQVPWQVKRKAAPGLRNEAALVFDEPGARVLLLGGRSQGKHAGEVWAMNQGGVWTQVSQLPPTDPARVDPLPAPSGSSTGLAQTKAALLTNGATRGLLAFLPGSPQPLWRSLGGPAAWQPVDGAVLDGGEPGELTCLAAAPDLAYAFALTPGGKLFRFAATSGSATVTAITISAQGSAQLPVSSAQCVIVGGALHILGGHGSGDDGGHLRVTFEGSAATATSGKFAAQPEPPAAMRRSGAFLTLHPSAQTLVIAGGHKRSGGVPAGLVDVRAWNVAAGSAQPPRLDREVPAARIGQVSGWSPSRGFCLGGGLRFDLPQNPAQPARALPVRDVWCQDVAGIWSKRTADGPLFAFGTGGVDPSGDRLVMAGGLPLQDGVELPDVARLWEARLPKAEQLTPPWLPVNTVRSVHLGTGQASPQVIPGLPALAAHGQVYDAQTNRVLLFGGFGANGETQDFGALHLGKLTYQDLGALVPKNPSNGKAVLPAARYGALMLHDPLRGLLALTGGSLRHTDGTIGLDFFPPLAGEGPLGQCFGYRYTTLWVTSLAPVPFFEARPVPTFAKPAPVGQVPQGPLVRPHFGGPAFLPVLYDPFGGRAWLAVQQAAQGALKDENGTNCPGPKFVPWTRADVQVSFDLGICGGSPRVVLSSTKLDPVPATLLLASAHYLGTERRSVLWGGVDEDGTLASATWRLDQTCKAP